MTLKHRFRIIFGLLAIMVISLLSIILFLIDNQKNVNSSADYRYNSYNLGLDSKINSDLLTSLARSYVITREKKYLDKYLNVVQMLEGTAPWPDGIKKSYDQRLQEMNFTTDELNKLDQSNKLSLNLVNLEDTAFSAVEILADKNNTQLNSDEIEQWISAINTIHGESYENEVSKIKAPVDDFFVMLNQRTVTELHDVEKNSESLGFTALILVIIILVILLIAYITIERRVIKPTSLLVKEVKLVTDGDLTRKIPMTGKDELTNLSSAFNDMITKTSNLIQDIRQQSELVNEFSEQLNEISSNSLKFTSEQSKAVEDITASVHENSIASKEIASTCSGSVASISDISQHAEHGKQVIGESLTSVITLSEQLTASMDRLELLVNSVTDVTQIIDVINGIAEQTNLLALNAAIEAARAGDLGRGFAVVADEVRTLAQRTQGATSEIKNKILMLENVSKEVVLNVKSSDEGIKNVSEKTTEADDSLTKIETFVFTTNDMLITISAAAEQQSQVTDDISHRLSVIQESSISGTEQSNIIAETASKLKIVSDGLNQGISLFKVDP